VRRNVPPLCHGAVTPTFPPAPSVAVLICTVTKKMCYILDVVQVRAMFHFGVDNTIWRCLVGVAVCCAETVVKVTRCSAIAERPRCRVRYSFCQKYKTGTGRIFYGQYRSIFNHCDIIGQKICRIP